MRILVTHNASAEHLAQIRQAAPQAEVIVAREAELVAEEMPRANIIWGSRYLNELLPQAKQLDFIQVSSAGVDRLLTPELLQHPAQLVNARGIHGATIAEHVFMLMLALARDLPAVGKAQARHKWIRTAPAMLAGATLGIIGYGSIGQAIARRAKAFDMQVIGLRRSVQSDPYADRMVDNSGLQELLQASDFVVLATPLTPETHHLLGAAQLAQMKPTAYLINIARGPVVDEVALIKALQAGQIAGAGLDVFVTEPLPADSPLWDLPNVLVTPHMAGHMPDYDERVIAIFLENLRRYQQGQPLINVVDKQAGY